MLHVFNKNEPLTQLTEIDEK